MTLNEEQGAPPPKHVITGTRKTVLALLLSVIVAAPVVGQTRRRTQPSRRTEPRLTVPPIPPARPPAAAPQPAQSADISGTLSGATYTNAYLGFTLTLPEGWQAQDTEVRQHLERRTQEVLEDATRNRTPQEQRAVRESAARTTAPLLVAVKPTEKATNPTFLLVAENIALQFNIRSPRQYVEQMRDGINKSNAPQVFEDEITAERVGGVEFAVVKARPRTPLPLAPNVEQLYYVTIRRNYALAFVLTYNSPDELKDCLGALRAVRFRQ